MGGFAWRAYGAFAGRTYLGPRQRCPLGEVEQMAGRPSVKITAEMLRQAEELAGYGLSQPQIAAVLGFSERTLRERKADNEAFSAALARGKAKAAGAIGKALYKRATDGDVPAIRWWEMTRDGRSERVSSDARHEVSFDPEIDARLGRLLGAAWTSGESVSPAPDEAE